MTQFMVINEHSLSVISFLLKLFFMEQLDLKNCIIILRVTKL